MNDSVDIIVSGHLCIDLIPDMHHVTATAMSTPGLLSETGGLVVSTGGAVSNTGLTLNTLGVPVGLMATIGDDAIGQMILTYLRERGASLTDFITIRKGQPSSYTIALSPMNADRTFLHCPGPNDTFGADDVDFELVGKAKIFHLGYPALMARLRENEGAELTTIYQRAKMTGVITSLDMARPDPASPSGRVNWRKVIENTLPFVDIFVPSIEEILFMLRREDFNRWHGDVLSHLTLRYLGELAAEMLDMGSAVVGFKLGEMGMYLRTGRAEKLQVLSRLPINLDQWANCELSHPAFQVEVAGTTGAGDAAYGGLLAAMLHGMTPYHSVRWACAVGACCVEAFDSNSGIRPWAEIRARIDAGWMLRPETIPN